MTSVFLIALVLLCVSPFVSAEPVWVSGSEFADQVGTYNNSAGKENVIGARYQAANWVDANRVLIFGGSGQGNSTNNTAGPLNDLWAFNATSEVWTYANGSGRPLDNGAYIPRFAEYPGSRRGASYWQANGLQWVFGGFGTTYVYINTNRTGLLSDIWALNTTDFSWDLKSGTAIFSLLNIPPRYSRFSAYPGARESSATWVVKTGAENVLWLFGGTTSDGLFNQDLWTYNLTSSGWTYFRVNGTLPSARAASASWVGADGLLYLFGGQGFDPFFHNATAFNDIWQFNTSSLQWKNVSEATKTGVYNNTIDARPSPRFGAAFTHDSLGNLWLFGGNTADTNVATLNDLWTYNTSAGNWTWVLGSSLPNSLGVYNHNNATTNRLGTPASRAFASLWIDGGWLWLFGGINALNQTRNDLWKLYDTVSPKPPASTTGSRNDTTTGHALTTGGAVSTGPHNTGELTTGGITSGSVSSGNSTSAHHPVSPGVISGTIVGGSVAITFGIAGVFLYKRRNRMLAAEEDNELTPIHKKPELN